MGVTIVIIIACAVVTIAMIIAITTYHCDKIKSKARWDTSERIISKQKEEIVRQQAIIEKLLNKEKGLDISLNKS